MKKNLFLGLQPTIVLAIMLFAIILMMILPMPAIVLDIGLAASFALAILIFTVTLFIERPLDFSAFPTVLLASLMLRLSLNVSSTKLIIAQGHTGTDAAGEVIEGFAMFVMNGNATLGVVVFCVLLIVNFMVINKGATRMAEVGARFALDAMPGKQLAIDSDVAAGAIDHAEAKARRENDQAETTFFGSLDGASKFVKGDAIAGLLITALNLVVGLGIGILVMEMPFKEAFETYAILTVGDGLVSQIPAVIISIASALLLARGDVNGSIDLALVDQLGRRPAALLTVAVLLGLFALVPGLPFLPFMMGAAVLGGCAWLGMKNEAKGVENIEPPGEEDGYSKSEPYIGDLLDLEDIHVEFSHDLVDMVIDPGTGLDARITNMRKYIAEAFGLILQEVRLTDNASLEAGTYIIHIQGVEQARNSLHPEKLLVLLPEEGGSDIRGDLVREPVYGAPAKWVEFSKREDAAFAGLTIVQAPEVLATHLLETIKQNFARLLSYKALRRRLDEMVQLSDQSRAEANRRLLDEMIPDRVPMDILLSVLRHLLEERVSIRNIPLILEAVAEARQNHQGTEAITEHVRQRLGFQIVAEFRRPDGTVPLIQLAPEWEDTFSRFEIRNERNGISVDIALPPDDFNLLADKIAAKLDQTAAQGHRAVVVTSVRRRRFLRTLMSARGIFNPVLSFEEIGLEARPSLVGLVSSG